MLILGRNLKECLAFQSTVCLIAEEYSGLRTTPEDLFESWHKIFHSKPIPFEIKFISVQKLKKCKHKVSIPLTFSKIIKVYSNCSNLTKPVKMLVILLSAVFQQYLSFEIFFSVNFFCLIKDFSIKSLQIVKTCFLGP